MDLPTLGPTTSPRPVALDPNPAWARNSVLREPNAESPCHCRCVGLAVLFPTNGLVQGMAERSRWGPT
jgi:hypothetical protein